MTILVADIGGSNARFACYNTKQNQLSDVEVFHCNDYDHAIDAIDAYLSNKDKPSYACFAVAAPIMGDEVKWINNNWHFSIQALQKHYQFKHLNIINDFDAIAYSILALTKNDFIQIGAQTPVENGPISILGPGTGFGNAVLLPQSKTVISSQGGHSGFAPASELEFDIFRWAQQKSIGLSRENFVSGMGIVNTYHALCDIHKDKAIYHEAADITDKALSVQADKLCKLTLEVFCSFLGNIAGDQALSAGATGGVYIAGGITKRFIPFVEQSAFRPRFENKGLISHYVKAIPTYVLSSEHPGLLGAGIAADTLKGR